MADWIVSSRRPAPPPGECADGLAGGPVRAQPGEGEPEEARRRRFFQAEVERLMDRLYGTAVRLTRNGADAEDLVAETLSIPVGTVRSRLSRGRRLFQDAVWHRARELGLTTERGGG